MSVRPRLKREQKHLPMPTAASYRLTPMVTPKGKGRKRGNEALVLLPNGITLTQNPAIPRLPGQVGFRGDRPVNLEDFALAAQESEMPVPPMSEVEFVETPDYTSPSKHRTKRLRQWERWTTEILPLIISPYLELQHSTQSLRNEAVLNIEGRACECCQNAQKLTIWLIRFSSMPTIPFHIFNNRLTGDTEIEQVELWASDCSKAAVQLIRSGLFPCSPIYPTLAVDIRVLDFVRRLFLRIAPNYTAWCHAATDFLAAQGYRLPGEDPLRRRFANALQWFMSLNDITITRIDTFVQHVRQAMVPESSTSSSHLKPFTHCGDAPVSQTDEEDTRPERRGLCGEEALEKDLEERETRKRDRGSTDDEWDKANEDADGRESYSPLSRPTEYLCSRCMACFGSDW